MNDSKKYDWAKPLIGELELTNVKEAMHSTWLSGGAFVDQLEGCFKNYFQSKYSYCVNNGTSALHAAYLSINLMAGDEIIVPGYGFMAAANVAIQMGLSVKFCDVSLKTWCQTPENILKVITNNTKAIVVIHNYGNCDDIAQIRKICNEKKIYLIEDCAESLGSIVNGELLGVFGDVSTFSFQATKMITTGEGGLIITNNPTIAENVSLYRSHGMTNVKYKHKVPGNNFRLSNLLAAVGCAQFNTLDERISLKKELHANYLKKFDHDSRYAVQDFGTNNELVMWAFALRLVHPLLINSRDEIIEDLKTFGIETRNGFYSPNELSYFGPNILEITNSDLLSKSVISFPSSFDLKDHDIEFIKDAFHKIIEKKLS